jgi:hypothetical protein
MQNFKEIFFVIFLHIQPKEDLLWGKRKARREKERVRNADYYCLRVWALLISPHLVTAFMRMALQNGPVLHAMKHTFNETTHISRQPTGGTLVK